jgi:hypothetical protein
MRRFNKLLEEVRTNRNKQYSKDVEDATFKTLAERYKTLLAGSSKNTRKRHHHVSEHSDGDDDEGNDDNPIFPEDELILLAAEMEQV